MSGSLTVGIDIGTTATKAVAADGDGRVVARARVAHRVLAPAPDQLEHDAVKAWRQGPLKALAEVTAVAPDPAGVCVASMVPSMTAVDGRGRPVVPGLLYGDARGRKEDPSGPDGALGLDDVSSVMPDAVGFLRWAVREKPGAHGYWPAQAVANNAIGGVPAIDTAMAMSLGELHKGEGWNLDVLGDIGVTPEQLPVVVNMAEAAGTVRGSDAVLVPGTVDALCDQIVSGAEHTGDVLVICGATLVVWAVTDDWIEVPGLWTVPHLISGKVMIGGPSNAGALFVDWARALLAGGTRRVPSPSRPSVDEPAERRGDPGNVPVWLPYVRGERCPFHDPAMRASLHDLHISHESADVERAAYEASGFVVRAMLERAGVTGTRIVASGGGTRNLAWMQAIADATGLPVDVVAVHEGSALGAAFLARMAAGLETSLNDASRWAAVGERIEPDSRWQRAASERFARFVALSPST